MKKKVVLVALYVIIVTTICLTFVSKFDKSSTMRKALIADVSNGNANAIDYAERHYGTTDVKTLAEILH